MKHIVLFNLSLALLSLNLRAQSTKKVDFLVKQMEAAANHHDAKAFASCFAADADFTNVIGTQAHGRTAIENLHRPLFAATPNKYTPSFHNATLHIEKKTVRFIAPNVASIDVWWDQSGAVGPDGKPWAPRKGLINAIAMEENGQWLFKIFHNMDTGEFKPNK